MCICLQCHVYDHAHVVSVSYHPVQADSALSFSALVYWLGTLKAWYTESLCYVQPKGQQPARPDLVSLAAQRIQQPLSPSLLTSNPLLANAAFGQPAFGAYAHAAPPPLRPDYSTHLPPLYDHLQQQQPAHNGYGTHAHYLPNNMAQFGYSAASLADISSFSGAVGQPVQLPSLGQYGQPSDAPHNPYSPAIRSNQAQIPSQPDTYYSQGALPGSSSVTLPYSQAYPSVPGGAFFHDIHGCENCLQRPRYL